MSLWLFVPFFSFSFLFLVFAYSKNDWTNFNVSWLTWRGFTQGNAFWGSRQWSMSNTCCGRQGHLHWLPVLHNVQFKLCMLTFKVLHRLALSYLADLCRLVVSVSSRQRLRSSTHGDVIISSTVMNFGAHSFGVGCVAGPKTSCCHIYMWSSRSSTSKLL